MLLTLALALTGSVLAIELLVYAKYRAGPPTGAFTESHSLLGWRNRPMSSGRLTRADFDIAVKINAYGMRDLERLPGRQSDRIRVAVLGDSIAYGLGTDQEDRFDTILAERLEVEMLNFAVPGYGPDQEYLVLQQSVAEYYPDAVLVVYYSGNDDLDLLLSTKSSQPKPQFILNGGQLSLIPPPSSTPGPGPLQRLLQRSVIRQWVARIRLRDRKTAQRQENASFRAVLPAFARSVPPEMAQARAIKAALFREIQQWAAGRGATAALVIVPLAQQVSDQRWRQAVMDAGLNPNDYDRTGPTDDTVRAAQGGLPVLDLLPYFEAAEAGGYRVFHPFTGVPSPEGHRVMADALAPWLEEVVRSHVESR